MAADGTQPKPSKPLPPERRTANSLPSACLLGFTGGALDAFLYLNHGKVFAGAQTGNAVLSGIALLSHNHHEALHHLLPIGSFLLGVWGERALEKHLRHHAVLIGLSVEIAVLFAASWLPARFPDDLFIFGVSIVCAYQVSSFRTVDESTYNSTFITGNMRSAISALHSALDPAQRPGCLRKFRDLGLIILCFIAGAVGGAFLAPRCGNRTLWLPVAALLLILLLAIRSNHAPKQTGEPA